MSSDDVPADVDGVGDGEFQEIRTINLPPRQTAGVNRLLREGEGWRIVDAEVVQETKRDPDTGEVIHEPRTIYIMGQRRGAEEDL